MTSTVGAYATGPGYGFRLVCKSSSFRPLQPSKHWHAHPRTTDREPRQDLDLAAGLSCSAGQADEVDSLRKVRHASDCRGGPSFAESVPFLRPVGVADDGQVGGACRFDVRDGVADESRPSMCATSGASSWRSR